MKQIILSIICLVCAIQVQANVIFTMNGITYDNYSSTVYQGKYLNVRVTNITGSGDLVIPEIPAEYGDGLLYFRVTEIAANACSDPDITSITIPNSVTSIGQNAFSACANLYVVTVSWSEPSSVSYGSDIFGDASNMVLHVPEGAELTYYEISPWKYFLIGNLNLPAFHIVNGTLVGYYGADGDVVIPDGISRIAAGACFEHTGITSVTVPNSVTSIGEDAFGYCSNLKSITIPNSVTSIGERTFAYSGLCSIVIPNSIATINFSTFKDCFDLSAVSIPNSVESIGTGAFYGCTGLSYIVVSWSNPASVMYEDDNEDFHIFGEVDASKVKLYVPVGTKAAYQAIETWKNFDIVEGTGPTAIANIERHSLQLYPNPAIDFVTISGLQINETICLFDLNGRLLINRKATKENETISVNHLPAGLYVVKIGNEKIVKLVKKSI